MGKVNKRYSLLSTTNIDVNKANSSRPNCSHDKDF